MRAFVIAGAIMLPLAATAETLYPVPSGAVAVRHLDLQPGVYEQDHFRLTDPYPGRATTEHYTALLSSWRSCPETNGGWQSFLDGSDSEWHFVHQLIRHWVSSHDDAVIILVLRYESPGVAYRTVPADDQQIATLIRIQTNTPGDYLDFVGVKCTKDT